MAALLISEAHMNAKRMKEILFLTALHTQKAFDVVNHSILLDKLFQKDIPPEIWETNNEMYNDLTSRVNWKGQHSNSFPVQQGVRPGGILSTHLYKIYIEDLLIQLEDSNIGLYLGTNYAGCSTCADDILLLSNSDEEMQVMLNVVDTYSKEHQYNIHPEKSVLIKQNENSTNSRKTSICSWSLGDRSVSETDKASHLGIIRSSKNENIINVKDRISLARRTTYLLMSTGALPTRTASVAVFSLLGALPIEAELHNRQLSLLHSILAPENQNLRDIFLPSIDELLAILPTKIKWKQTVRYAINTFWSNKFGSLSREKSTLIRLCTDTINIGEIRPVWKTATEIPGDTKKAITKARILTGTYRLQATKAKFNIGSTDPICPLCKLEEENFQHFLTRCPFLEGVRRTFYAPLKQAVIDKIGIDQWKTNFQNRETLTQLIVDCRKLVGSTLPNDSNFLNTVESISRNLCDKLHQQRLTQIIALSL
ncbi:unnamed protein product [Mytilus coruscus]|uniref:Reverse transcriptase domain-containing protein n=1 Tax=Mytilus coruscus TaxID=42192 RepID=A0A6J8A365_MYTCO|nr:unnamed protein product [Mytilus coruscus]